MPDLSQMSDEDLRRIAGGGQGQTAAPPRSVSEMTDAELAVLAKAGQPAPPGNVAEDVAKSAGTGLTRGLANVLGWRGDLMSLAQTGAQAGVEGIENLIGYKRTPEQEAIKQELLKKAQFGRMPTSQDIRDTASKITGVELYEPQTTPGKYLETAGEFASGTLAALPKSLSQLGWNALKYGVLPGLGSEGAGQAAQTIAPGNKTVETIARIVGGAVPAVGVAAASSRTGMRPPAPGVDPNQRIRMAKEFEVPLTEGQATGNITQQGFEEAARHGAKGPRATETMQQFEARQKAALDAAGGRVRERFEGGFAPVQGADVAGETLAAAIKRKVAEHEAEASRLYKSSEAKGTVVDQGAAANVLNTVAQKLATENHSFDQGLHPSAFAALKDIKELGDMGSASSTGVGLKQIDTIRQRLNQYSGINSQDARAVGLVKKAFDGWLDDAINAKLFSGDPAGLAELKAARGQVTARKRITDPKAKDDAGQQIAKMAEDGRTGQEVGNWLYGSSIVNPPATTVRMAQRIKGMFGQQSEEWSAIRQGAWTRVVQGATASEKGAQAVSTAVNEFLNGRGKALSQVLYSPEERELMSRFGQTAKFLVPNPMATNPSKSGFTGARLAQASLRGLGMLLGATQHADPFTGGIGGFIAGQAIDQGTQAARNVANAAAATRSVNPKLNAPIFDPANVAALVGRAAIFGGQ